ncbi:hypothetical protein EYF80_006872 [Liparis tanakae]|uniref:Uncharacterized protein n=1 Tax=Liparis tanakae TaxID=230148 RepID=A0A4Z2IY58_9TELE|nr:hypothetical protein EYF80_006872 [Liparis tanakae]
MEKHSCPLLTSQLGFSRISIPVGLTLAALDEYGSSNKAQTFGCQTSQQPLDLPGESSMPNRLGISRSSSASGSGGSNVIQQHGSTSVSSIPQYASSSSNSGPQTSAGQCSLPVR